MIRRKAGLSLVALLLIVTVWAQGIAGSAQYTYDTLNRLIKVERDDGTVVEYTYDAAGNRLTRAATVPAPPPRTLTVTRSGLGSGTITSNLPGIDCGETCSGQYAHGTSVILTAVPLDGSMFKGWSGGGCSGNGTCTVTMNADTSVTATFQKAPRMLTVIKSGSGSGTVSSDPSGIDCGEVCSSQYPDGSAVVLTATPLEGSVFAGWAMGGYWVTGPCMVELTADIAVTAAFESASIAVVKPNGGETWYAGTAKTIEWTYAGNPGGTVKIMLLKGDVPVKTIATVASIGKGGKGSRNWTVPANQTPGDDYKIRIASTTDSSIADLSDTAFSIKTRRPVEVLAPNGSENLQVGSGYTIRWKSTVGIGPKVKIELVRDETVAKTIASSAPSYSRSSGSYQWAVPKTLAYGNEYRIRVTSNETPSYADTSNKVFSISGPTLDIAAPDGGESWPKGSRQNITWTYTGEPLGTVKIQLLKAGVAVRTISSGTSIGSEGKGSFRWAIPGDLNVASVYRVKISHTTIRGCTGLSSNEFSISKAIVSSPFNP